MVHYFFTDTSNMSTGSSNARIINMSCYTFTESLVYERFSESLARHVDYSSVTRTSWHVRIILYLSEWGKEWWKEWEKLEKKSGKWGIVWGKWGKEWGNEGKNGELREKMGKEISHVVDIS